MTSSRRPVQHPLSSLSQNPSSFTMNNGTIAHSPFVSNGPDAGVLVQRMGTIPMAREIARTRSSIWYDVTSRQSSNVSTRPGCIELTNIPKWRTHCRRCNAKHTLDGFACPTKFSDDLLGCHSRKRLIKEYHQQEAAQERGQDLRGETTCAR